MTRAMEIDALYIHSEYAPFDAPAKQWRSEWHCVHVEPVRVAGFVGERHVRAVIIRESGQFLTVDLYELRSGNLAGPRELPNRFEWAMGLPASIFEPRTETRRRRLARAS